MRTRLTEKDLIDLEFGLEKNKYLTFLCMDFL